MPPKLSFLDMPAPAGYVPGLGRGATGFSTRADLGSAARSGLAASGAPEDDPDRFQDPDDAGIFGGGNRDEEDEEADRIYEAIDKRMEERNATKRAAREAREQQEEAEQPQIANLFADAKRALAEVTADEWLNLPESGDQTRKNKRARIEARANMRSYNLSDTMLSGMRDQADVVGEVAEEAGGSTTDVRAISMAKDRILGLKLGGASDHSNDVDAEGYVTSLNAMGGHSDAEMADIKKMRPFVESLIRSNPKSAPGWIAAVRLAELRKKPSQAVQLAAQGCSNCPKSEDMWLESIRVNDPANARVVAAQAVDRLPASVKIWQAAADLENEDGARKKVLRKALMEVPQSVELWKQLVNMEEDHEARELLREAVKCVPLSVDLWLALARLEDQKTAEKVLNKARKAVRTAPEIWIAAARLREQVNGQAKDVDKIMAKGVAELADHGRTLSRQEWLNRAHVCETEGAILACNAIIRTTMSRGLADEQEHVQTDVYLDSAADPTYPHTARAIYTHALSVLPRSRKIWTAAVALERRMAESDSEASNSLLWETLEQAVTALPLSAHLWLTYIREQWHRGLYDKARDTLVRAFEHVSSDESIWLEAVSLELEAKQPERARSLLKQARDTEVATEALWTRAVLLERQLREPNAAIALANDALGLFPDCGTLWIQKGHAQMDSGEIDAARDTFQEGTKNSPKSVWLWMLLADAEEARGIQIRARSVLEKAALVNPANEELWLARLRLEIRAGNTQQVKGLTARALQECPSSGRLWTESIALEPRTHRKTKLMDAVSKNESDPYILVLLARWLWQRKKFDKASKWLTTALEADRSNGDTWLWAYKFYSEQNEGVEECLAEFNKAEPTTGEQWVKIKEDINNYGKSAQDMLRYGSQQLVL